MSTAEHLDLLIPPSSVVRQRLAVAEGESGLLRRLLELAEEKERSRAEARPPAREERRPN
jgi:hypothetical protein